MAELETRRLGKTEMRPKALGLGCAAAGEPEYSDNEAVEGIQRAVELGIDFIDTSPHYGESERRVGLALRDGLRDKVYLQTKVGTHPDRFCDFSAEATRWSVENSLGLLGTDYLDAALIHDPVDIETPLAPGAALDELLALQGEGVIGHVGLGVRSHAFHQRAIRDGRIEIVLTYLDYTLLNQSAAHTIIPLALQHDVGIILGSIFAMGLLTGKEPDSQREIKQYPGQKPRAHQMLQWCRKRGVDLRHLAIQFAMAAPVRGNGIVMPGPVGVQEVEETIHAATAPIPGHIWRDFEAEFGVGIR
jgi:aryl-alcohol dehydrogenase-like predicted oxidoreductase